MVEFEEPFFSVRDYLLEISRYFTSTSQLVFKLKHMKSLVIPLPSFCTDSWKAAILLRPISWYHLSAYYFGLVMDCLSTAAYAMLFIHITLTNDCQHSTQQKIRTFLLISGIAFSLCALAIYSIIGIEVSLFKSCLSYLLPILVFANLNDEQEKESEARLPSFTTEILPGEINIQDIIVPTGKFESGKCTCGCFVATPLPDDPSFIVISRPSETTSSFESETEYQTMNAKPSAPSVNPDQFIIVATDNEKEQVPRDDFPPNYIPIYNFPTIRDSKQ